VLTLVIALIGSLYLWQTKFSNRFDPSQAVLNIPGGQLWAAERSDPYGTHWTRSVGPTNPQALWVFKAPAGFSGSPVISSEGTIYAADLDRRLLALNPDGTKLWETSLAQVPLGPLALGPQGIIYVTDSNGGLSAFSPDGHPLWTFETSASGKPNHGAIVAPNGTIYYLLEDTRGDTLFALLPNGALLWFVQPGTRQADTGLRLTSDGQEIFVKNVVINAADGTIVELTLPTQGNVFLSGREQLLVGADGKTYLLAGHVVMQWQQTPQGFSLVQSADWNWRGAGMIPDDDLPTDAGVTPQGNILLFYSSYFEVTSLLYWLDPMGIILGNYLTPFYETTRLVGIDGMGVTYICGTTGTFPGHFIAISDICEAYPQDGSTPLWSYTLDIDPNGVVGAAMAPGRLYVITGDGTLTALADNGSVTPIATIAP
jgi:outer membrane protein assembly factor BamB